MDSSGHGSIHIVSTKQICQSSIVGILEFVASVFCHRCVIQPPTCRRRIILSHLLPTLVRSHQLHVTDCPKSTTPVTDCPKSTTPIVSPHVIHLWPLWELTSSIKTYFGMMSPKLNLFGPSDLYLALPLENPERPWVFAAIHPPVCFPAYCVPSIAKPALNERVRTY